MKNFFVILLRFRFVIITTILLVVILAGFGIKNYSVDNGLASWFVEGDQNLINYEEFKKDFGNDETISVVLTFSDNPFAESNNIVTKKIVDKIKLINGVKDVFSYLNYRNPPFISDDGKSGLILIIPDLFTDENTQRSHINTSVREILREECLLYKIKYSLAGIGIIYDELNIMTLKDSTLFIMISYILLIIFLSIALKNFKYIVVGLIIIGASLIVSLGIMFHSGAKINMVSMVLPVLIIIYGISDLIHIINCYKINITKGLNKSNAIVSTMNETAFPCFMTSFTTAIGLSTLYFTEIKLLKEFALFAATGVMIEYLITILLLPAFLSLLPFKNESEPKISVFSLFIKRFVQAMIKRRMIVIVVSLVIMVIMGVFCFFIKVDTYTIKFFKSDNRVRVDSEFIEKHFSYYTPLEIVCSGEKGAFIEPDNLKIVSAFINKVTEHEYISRGTTVFSVNPVMLQMGNADLVKGIIERTPVLNRVMKSFVNDDYSKLRITFTTKMVSSSEYSRLIEYVMNNAGSLTQNNISIKTAGYMPLYVKIVDYITKTQLNSFILSFIIVFGVIVVYAGTFRLAFYSVLVNLFPLIVTLGFMGISGIRLDIATVTIAAIAIGISVDDTIHFLCRYKKSKDLTETIELSGSSIVSTSLIFAGGFSVLLLSGVKSIVYFGLLIIIFLIAALIGDLILLPALLSKQKHK